MTGLIGFMLEWLAGRTKAFVSLCSFWANPFEGSWSEVWVFFNASRDSSVIIVTKLRTGQRRNRFRFPAEARHFCHLRNVKTGPVTHPASCSVGTRRGGGVHPVANRPGREVDRLFHLMPRLKMCGDVPSLPSYPFVTYTGTPLCILIIFTRFV
jgi:hypothetical protein